MIKKSLGFLFSLTLSLSISFAIHGYIKTQHNQTLLSDMMLTSYWINGLLAFISFLVLHYLKNRKSNSLGFIFMLGSGVKFAVFFIVFYPVFNSDGDLDRGEFFSFFVPYAISLIVETTILVRIMSKEGSKSTN